MSVSQEVGEGRHLLSAPGVSQLRDRLLAGGGCRGLRSRCAEPGKGPSPRSCSTLSGVTGLPEPLGTHNNEWK
ncbi:hypothetical protein AV530_007466 [Patagioenas fasciata monilis]|uniref:Uncharacterized protein n=1 Tax=Patagioenas fasciata monilis TaxID=372326 RepID=A0A1V4JXW4_PATFA|nr:hypothetical protein AV530_007466 [Patagioenas fasciata monilis]